MRRMILAGMTMGVLAGVMALVLAGSGGCGSASAEQKAYDDMSTLKTVQEFEEKVEQSSRPVLVDFYATWCGPCKQLAPTIGSLASEYGDRVDFYRVDVDKAPELAKKMRIKVIPTVFIYVAGEPVDKFNFASRETYAKALDEAIQQSSAPAISLVR